MRSFLPVVVALSTVIACSGATTTDLLTPDGSTDGSSNDGSSKDTSVVDASADGFPGACTPSAIFPSFQKGCGTTANCIIKLHQIDCCGSMAAIGLNHGEFAAFDQSEQAWESSCPRCKCVAKATVAEDGNSGPNADVKVSCDNGVCRTTL